MKYFIRLNCVRAMLLAVCALSAAGCNLSDTGPSAYQSPDQFFSVLALEHHAINLSMVAPYDTVTLRAVHAMGDGSEVPGELVYTVSNPSISVANGVLKAESPVTRAVVRVALTYGTITRTDSAIVSVTAAAPTRLRDVGLRLPVGDSAKVGAGVDMKTIPLVRESESGSDLSTLLVSVVSSDTTVAAVTQFLNEVSVVPKRPGRVVLYTSSLAFGTAWQDSLVFTVGWPTMAAMVIYERFAAGSLTPLLDFGIRDITIGVGGCVRWATTSAERDVDLEFEDPAHVVAPAGNPCAAPILDPTVGGNIAPFRVIVWDGDPANALAAFFSPFRARAFSAPGVYPYRSTIYGTSGTVRVCDERADTTCAPSRLGGWN